MLYIPIECIKVRACRLDSWPIAVRLGGYGRQSMFALIVTHYGCNSSIRCCILLCMSIFILFIFIINIIYHHISRIIAIIRPYKYSNTPNYYTTSIITTPHRSSGCCFHCSRIFYPLTLDLCCIVFIGGSRVVFVRNLLYCH